MHKSFFKINIIGFTSIFLIVSISLANRSCSDRSNIEDNQATVKYNKTSKFETLPYAENPESQKVSFEVQPYNLSNKIVIEPLNLAYD